MRFLATFLKGCREVDLTVALSACRDPKDNMLLDLAVSGTADYLITGDDDLLALDPFRGIRIVTPRQFLDIEV